jgi:hypothetical protein
MTGVEIALLAILHKSRPLMLTPSSPCSDENCLLESSILGLVPCRSKVRLPMTKVGSFSSKPLRINCAWGDTAVPSCQRNSQISVAIPQSDLLCLAAQRSQMREWRTACYCCCPHNATFLSKWSETWLAPAFWAALCVMASIIDNLYLRRLFAGNLRYSGHGNFVLAYYTVHVGYFIRSSSFMSWRMRIGRYIGSIIFG